MLNIAFEGNFDAKIYASGIQEAAKNVAAQVVVVSSSADIRFLTPLLAVGLEAGYATNVVAAPSTYHHLQ